MTEGDINVFLVVFWGFLQIHILSVTAQYMMEFVFPSLFSLIVLLLVFAQPLVVINMGNCSMESVVYYVSKSIIKLLLLLSRADKCIDILKCKATTIG